MHDHPDATMLFAAGLGTRMAPLTDTRPKPLIRVAGKPLIDHALELVLPLGLGRVVVNLHYLPDQLEAHLRDRPVTLIREEPEILDTGGGLRNAIPLLGQGPVITLNTDAVWTGPNPLQTLLDAWQPDRMDALVILIERDRAAGHRGQGDFVIGADGTLQRGPGPVYGGAQIIRPDLTETVSDKAFSLNLIWDQLIEQGRLHGVIHRGGWCDVGQPDSIPLAEDMLRSAHV